jgi:hypothetical protein
MYHIVAVTEGLEFLGKLGRSGSVRIDQISPEHLEVVILGLKSADPVKDIGLEVGVVGIVGVVGVVRVHRANDELVGVEESFWRCFCSSTPLLKVLTSRQGIGFAHFETRSVVYLEVVVRQKLGPSGLSAIENLGCREVLEVEMIGVDSDVFGTFEVWSPMFECFYDCKHLFVVDVVVEFGRLEFSGVICDGVELVLLIAVR